MATDFDYGQLDAITGGDTEFEREVIEEYLSSAPKDIAKLRVAIESGDMSATGATAHALKGASATLGAKGFAAVALVVEQAGKKSDTALAAQTIAQLETEFAEVCTLLRGRIGKAA
jgi:HPt (histidine-containing phosphotransfer) domain-containing protein